MPIAPFPAEIEPLASRMNAQLTHDKPHMDTPHPDRLSTRFVELRHGRPVSQRDNRATVMLSRHEAPPSEYFRLCFALNYDAIRLVCCRHTAPGVAVIAVDERGVAASAWLGAKYDRINSAIIGRHHAADVCLVDDHTVSLRHLALIAQPLREAHEVRFRVIDLRTPTAFTDERGQRLGALEAEGPAFIACGHYCLFFLPTGDELPWPAEAAAGWECLPDRVYLDEVEAEPDRWQRPRQYPAQRSWMPHRRTTAIRTYVAPIVARRHLVGDGDEPLGQLDVLSAWGSETLVLGRLAASGGVLLGRYDRCDNEGLRALCHERISRVHCLLIEVDGTLYVVDAASTNGTFVELPDTAARPDRVRVLPLRSDVCFTVGPGLVRLRWRSMH